MACSTEKRSVLKQFWNTGTRFAPKIPGQTPSTVFFMLSGKNLAPKIGHRRNEKVDLHIIVLFSFGGNEFSVLGKRFGVAPDRSDTTIFSVEPPPVYLPWNEHLVTIVFKNSPKWTIFGDFDKLLSTQNVNVARFARNVEWYFFFCDFQAPCCSRIFLQKKTKFPLCEQAWNIKWNLW